GPPLGTSPRAHASQTRSRAATPPPPCAAPLPAPPARRRVAQGQIDCPQTLLTSPRSSLAYKYPQNSSVARLLLLPPPPAVRHGRRDLARADQPPQPYIAPSNHPRSFSTFQLSSTRMESKPNPFPTPFPFCAAAGEL